MKQLTLDEKIQLVHGMGGVIGPGSRFRRTTMAVRER